MTIPWTSVSAGLERRTAASDHHFRLATLDHSTKGPEMVAVVLSQRPRVCSKWPPQQGGPSALAPVVPPTASEMLASCH